MKERLEKAFKTAFDKGRTLSNYPLDIRVTRYDENGNYNIDSFILTESEFDSFWEFHNEINFKELDAQIFENNNELNSAFGLDAGFMVKNGVITNY